MKRFDDPTIEALFGAEDAENENAERFQQYFFRNKAFENIANDLPIRVVVGHKGVGKSALLKKSFLDEREKNSLAVWIQPNDLETIRNLKPDATLNELVEAWKTGITRAVYESASQFVFGGTESAPSIRGGLVNALTGLFDQKVKDGVKVAQGLVLNSFLKVAKIYIYIDDVDRGWKASGADISNISALLNAARDMCGEDERLKIRIALRSDVYFLVRTSDESTDKIERNIVWLDWNNHDILCTIAVRVSTYFKLPFTQQQIVNMSQKQIDEQILSNVVEGRFGSGKGRWADAPIHIIILSLCRKRPRDLVKLLSGAAKKAFERGHIVITSSDLMDTFEHYSEERLQDIENEFRSELPGLRALLLSMKPAKRTAKTADSYQFTNDELVTKIKNIIGNVPLRFTDDRAVNQQTIIYFLYKIDFLIARFETEQGIQWRYFDQRRFLAEKYGDFGNSWEIHPAYRWALQPKSVLDVLDTIATADGEV